jgi:hypothetical protein
MAHWAELDENNIVIQILVGDNNDPNGDEGYQWLIHNLGGQWIKTSYNSKIRKQYAGIGYRYDEVNDVFIAPHPFPSWVLNDAFDWEAPIPRPEEGLWEWDEEKLCWAESTLPENTIT